MQAHEQFENSGAQQHGILSLPCRNNLAQSAMLAAVLDLRPLSFAENQEGMAYLLRAMFEAGKSIPLGVTVDKKKIHNGTNCNMQCYREYGRWIKDYG